jgi:hypothetical protein
VSPYWQAQRDRLIGIAVLLSLIFLIGFAALLAEWSEAKSIERIVMVFGAITVFITLPAIAMLSMKRARCPDCGWEMYYRKNQHGNPEWGGGHLFTTCQNCGRDLTKP